MSGDTPRVHIADAIRERLRVRIDGYGETGIPVECRPSSDPGWPGWEYRVRDITDGGVVKPWDRGQIVDVWNMIDTDGMVELSNASEEDVRDKRDHEPNE